MRVLLAAVTLVGAACTTGDQGRGDRQWAGRVDRWLVNEQKAARAGVPNLSAFLAPDVHIDLRGTAEGTAEGREAALSLFRVLQARDPERAVRPPAYVSTTGLVVPARWTLPAPVGRQDAVQTMTFSRRGLVRQESALSVDSGRRRLRTFRTGALARDWTPLEVLADRYVATWSRGDRVAASLLYDRSIVVRDRLLQQRADGLGQLVRRTRTTTSTRLQRLPGGGSAVFGVTTPLGETFDRAVLLVTADDGSGCPGHVAVVLEIARSGRVTGEERYHRLDDARRCLDPSQRPGGWWDWLAVPDPVPLERTGTVRADGASVEVWNGSAELEELVGWALGRYAAAGLPVPRPASVTFYPVARERCSGYAGITGGPRFTEITLCFGTEQACPSGRCPPWSEGSRRLVLHELAHTWMSEHLAEGRQRRYVEAVGMRWWDRADPWERRGVERAAETIAWGLNGVGSSLRRFGSPSPERLADEFRLLTGHDPLLPGDPM